MYVYYMIIPEHFQAFHKYLHGELIPQTLWRLAAILHYSPLLCHDIHLHNDTLLLQLPHLGGHRGHPLPQSKSIVILHLLSQFPIHTICL